MSIVHAVIRLLVLVSDCGVGVDCWVVVCGDHLCLLWAWWGFGGFWGFGCLLLLMFLAGLIKCGCCCCWWYSFIVVFAV